MKNMLDIEESEVYEVAIRLRCHGMKEEVVVFKPQTKDPEFRMLEKYAKKVIQKGTSISSVTLSNHF